jgi:hypothetical protein
VVNLALALATLEYLRRSGRRFRQAMSGGEGPGGREVLHPDTGDHGHTAPAHEETPLGAREPITVPIH